MQQIKERELLNTQQDAKRRYVFLDVLKILAIFFVLLYHAKGSFAHIANDSIQQNVNRIIGGALAICVPMFFMVNGALLLNKPLDMSKHLKKTLKLVLLIFFWNAVIYLLQIPVLGWGMEKVTFFGVIQAMLYKQGWNNYTWFLQQLVVLYLIFPFLKVLFDAHKKYFFFFTIISLFFTYGVSVKNSITGVLNLCFGKGGGVFDLCFNTLNDYNPSIKKYAFSLAIFMLGGILFHCLLQKRESLAKRKLVINIVSPLVIIVALVLGCFYNIIWKPSDVVWDSYDLIYTLILCVCLFVQGFVNEREAPKKHKVITLLGNNVMGIYLIHTFIQNYVFWGYRQFVDYSVVPMKWLSALTTFLISLLLSYAISKIKYINEITKL